MSVRGTFTQGAKMLDIEEDSRYEASEKTNVVTIGKWTYYQNTHLKNAPAWACYFGKHYCCTIYNTDLGYRYVVKEGDNAKNNLEAIYIGTDNQVKDINYIVHLKGEKSDVNIDVQGALKDKAKKRNSCCLRQTIC